MTGNTVCPLSKTRLILQFLDVADVGHAAVLNDVPRRVIITRKLPGISPQTRMPSCDEIFKGLWVTLLTVQDMQFVMDTLRFHICTKIFLNKQIYWIGSNRTMCFLSELVIVTIISIRRNCRLKPVRLATCPWTNGWPSDLAM